MKIGIVTIHHANSYGGTLQALATQEVFSRYGDTVILDYKTTHLKKTMWLLRLGCGLRDILRSIKDIFRLNARYNLLKEFRIFFLEYYQLSPKCDDLESLKLISKNLDVLVAGSDQLWNPDIVGGMDPAYYLCFENGKRKISYASSLGSHRYIEKDQQVAKRLLQAFDFVSVREKDTADYLSAILGGKSVSTVIDPTLLLDRKQWRSLLNLGDQGRVQNSYILVYTLKKNKLLRNLVNIISEALSLEVVVVDQDPVLGFKANKHLRSVGPRDFVDLIDNASYVITNSFHGIAFAINFKKPFVGLPPETGLNRIITLLDGVGLEKRLILEEDVSVVDESIDFSIVHEKLNEQRAYAFHYIENALHGRR